jgi:hypothetical protein
VDSRREDDDDEKIQIFMNSQKMNIPSNNFINDYVMPCVWHVNRLAS